MRSTSNRPASLRPCRVRCIASASFLLEEPVESFKRGRPCQRISMTYRLLSGRLKMLTCPSCAHQLTPECPRDASAGYGERSVSRDGQPPRTLVFVRPGGGGQPPLLSSTVRSRQRRLNPAVRASCRRLCPGGSE